MHQVLNLLRLGNPFFIGGNFSAESNSFARGDRSENKMLLYRIWNSHAFEE
jgi:hypothetical protein